MSNTNTFRCLRFVYQAIKAKAFVFTIAAVILVGLLTLGPMAPYSEASYTTSDSDSRDAEEFVYSGFKWLPGANTSINFGPTPAPGGATWSIMGAGLGLSPGVNFGEVADHGANLTQNFDSLLPAVGAEVTFVNQALNAWGAVSGFSNLGQVADGGVGAGASNATGGHLGDIRIAAWEIASLGVLAHAFPPGTENVDGPNGNIFGDLHMDVGHTWVDDPNDVTGNGNYDFFTVMLHEMGHALGLRHSDVSGSIMEPFYDGARRTLHTDDIAGIQAIYGAVPEPSSLLMLLGLFGSTAGIRLMRQPRQFLARS